MSLRTWTDHTVSEALGRHRRADPVRPVTGGPAGNARLTAWLGLVLLALFLVELGTLLDLRVFLDWHIIVGALLVPPALAKTASTGWRIVRYYTGHRGYRRAGPPPMPLRVLGPLVVLTTLAVLGTGIALVLVGPDVSRLPWFTVAGRPMDPLTLHKVTFLVWAVVTGLHALFRLLPAVQIVSGPNSSGNAVPGSRWRAGILAVTVLAAIVVAVFVVQLTVGWL